MASRSLLDLPTELVLKVCEHLVTDASAFLEYDGCIPFAFLSVSKNARGLMQTNRLVRNEVLKQLAKTKPLGMSLKLFLEPKDFCQFSIPKVYAEHVTTLIVGDNSDVILRGTFPSKPDVFEHLGSLRHVLIKARYEPMSTWRRPTLKKLTSALSNTFIAETVAQRSGDRISRFKIWTKNVVVVPNLACSLRVEMRRVDILRAAATGPTEIHVPILDASIDYRDQCWAEPHVVWCKEFVGQVKGHIK